MRFVVYYWTELNGTKRFLSEERVVADFDEQFEPADWQETLAQTEELSGRDNGKRDYKTLQSM